MNNGPFSQPPRNPDRDPTPQSSDPIATGYRRQVASLTTHVEGKDTLHGLGQSELSVVCQELLNALRELAAEFVEIEPQTFKRHSTVLECDGEQVALSASHCDFSFAGRESRMFAVECAAGYQIFTEGPDILAHDAEFLGFRDDLSEGDSLIKELLDDKNEEVDTAGHHYRLQPTADSVSLAISVPLTETNLLSLTVQLFNSDGRAEGFYEFSYGMTTQVCLTSYGAGANELALDKTRRTPTEEDVKFVRAACQQMQSQARRLFQMMKDESSR